MKSINLKGKKIRLFFHTDLDGTIAANLIQLFSGANIVEFMPCPYQSPPKPEKKDASVLDVFVDCRAKDFDEDIRIDHHSSGEDETYLAKEGIVVDGNFASAVSLVAKYLGIGVNPKILEEMDMMDSGQHAKSVFGKFTMDDNTIHKIIFDPKISKEDYNDFEKFKDKLLNFMVRGFSIESINSTQGYEQELEGKYSVVIEDIKKENKPLTKLIHSPTKGGFFKKVFTIFDSDFFENVLPYVNQHYEKEANENDLGVYVVVGFIARDYGYDDQLKKTATGEKVEKYQLFVKRSAKNTSIDIGALIQEAKGVTGITNGGGRDSVGGINTDDKAKAIKAINFIVEKIKENCP